MYQQLKMCEMSALRLCHVYVQAEPKISVTVTTGVMFYSVNNDFGCVLYPAIIIIENELQALTKRLDKPIQTTSRFPSFGLCYNQVYKELRPTHGIHKHI